MARVVLDQVGKTFIGPGGEEICAVHDLSLRIDDKELLVLVGPSGCGKSTTLRMIAGLEDISKGTISIDDQVVNQVSPKDRDVAMVFQNYALYPHMSVFENLAFGLKLRKFAKSQIAERVKTAASMLGLTSCLERKPAALSGGERQRVALGRAMVRQPRVFVLDEPLSNLDVPMRVQMRAEISRLHTRLGTTMIYVTHDQVEAMSMGDRVAVMKEGVLQQAGDPASIYHFPRNRFVAGFIGSPPMNFLSGVVVQEGRQFSLAVQSGGGALDAASPMLPIEQAQASRLLSYVGKKVILGLRAENISVENHDRLALPARIEVVEPMGSETYLYLASGGHTVVARVAGYEKFAVAQPISMVFDMTKAHFFDPVTELAVDGREGSLR